MDVEQRLLELERRLSNIVAKGSVSQVDASAARIKVAVGDVLTPWIRWAVDRAGDDFAWWLPSVGEQVLLLSPAGDFAQSVAVKSIYQDAYPAPTTNGDLVIDQFSDGSFEQLNKATGDKVISVTGDMNLEAGGDIRLNAAGDVYVNGQLIHLN